ncbi:hypothetical protein [Vibrio parahaemolyticus RIMD 2210633]|uniref:Uncharacterized protein n=1 Tax=Vibrio parahaemolyticus serotype O3:K6 (strain RIMD 2210633) TaxID=223926 RepID=Q87PB6_VIBPA|nr:hypothetical protein [Vibrio parahaemolyticus RIMD 2210633]
MQDHVPFRHQVGKSQFWLDGKALCLRKKKAPCKRVNIIYCFLL